jgi:hypothetical protein
MKSLFKSRSPKDKADSGIIVVSGLPRSGTSMMMKMLEQGGVPIVSDSFRRADDDNPNGYYELEMVKKMSEGQTGWLTDADHKAVKVISALLEHLPQDHRYKVIFMERQSAEILASQRKMLDHRNEKNQVTDEEMQRQFQEHLAAVKYWLARQPNMEVMYVDYNRMMADPDGYCQPIADFISLPVDVAKMRAVPNAGLYRNRTDKPGPGKA